jgi:hypothetical protein
MNWTRINNDSNGNPRYVCHFFALLTPQEANGGRNLYNAALIRARKIGGKKFHNKQFGGGIVFQYYSIPELEKAIKEELAK